MAGGQSQQGRTPGVDGCSIADFEAELQANLYKVWNRMSSGTYFPPPVLAVEIPKQHGGGVRMLGVPTVADRVSGATRGEHVVLVGVVAGEHGVGSAGLGCRWLCSTIP